MIPNQLAAAGRALYGERWQTSLATDLHVVDRTMRRWLAGETSIPDGIKNELRGLLINRGNEINDVIQYSCTQLAPSEFFSGEALKEFQERLSALDGKFRHLRERYVSRNYKNPKAREYAAHGFSRRLETLARCVDNVFRMLPPDLAGLPTEEALSDATINIQAFVFNAFGALDNLALIWVHEHGVTKPNGSQLSPKQIGLGADCEQVRLSFSPTMQNYLKELNPWFEHLTDFRHALAHRIPLYIIVTDANQAAYMALDVRKSATHDLAEYERIKEEQLELVVFQPVMKHTLYDQIPPVVFHCQLLSDFATIEEIGQKLLEELGHT
jgi:hypothetical protein